MERMSYTQDMTDRGFHRRSLLSRILSQTSDTSTSFPLASYFAVMGELAENYAGTSSVLFHRSNAISNCTGAPVEILVFGHVRDYDKLNDEMHADGRLAPDVRFRSMWKDFALMEHDRGPTGNMTAFAPLDEVSADETIRGEGVAIRRFRKDDDGKNLQIDLLRPDGSIIVSDRRDASPRGRRSPRSIILCDQSSQPVAEFTSINALRYYWLDHVIGSDQAVLFSDTLGMASITHSYKRENVIVIQTFHNHHLRHDTIGALGYTGAESLPLLKNIDDFDATVFLSKRQLADVDTLMGPSPSRRVIPNSRPIHEENPDHQRPRTAGIMLSQLNARKQPGHAIRAIAQANSQMQHPVSLDIYGQGKERESLEATIKSLGADTIHLRGYDPAASEKFAESTFSLLTSRSEAMGLVLVESMASGCIPIAYDIRYGPRDIVTDGVDGFLVPLDDIDGLADTIVRLQSMSERSIARLRKNAIKRARDFSDTTVLKQWAALIAETFEAKVPPAPIALTLHSSTHRCDPGALTIRADLTVQRKLHKPRAHVALLGRNDPAITRVAGELTQTGPSEYSLSAQIDSDRVDWFTRGILDASLEIYDQAGHGSVRLRSESDAQDFGPFSAYPTAHGNLSLKRS